jgi:hypothetical protein
MKNVTKLLSLVCTAFIVIAALSFTSCNAIAEGTGLYTEKSTTWIWLAPAAASGTGAARTAVLTLDFSRAIDGLVDGIDEDALAKIISFEYDNYAPGAALIKATGVKKLTDGMYRLTVVNVPGNSGIVRVKINKAEVTPTWRPWSLGGQTVPEDLITPTLLDFRFTKSTNPSSTLVEDAEGGIDLLSGTVKVVVPQGTALGALTPTLTVPAGCIYTPEGVNNFTSMKSYRVEVESEATGVFKDYEVFVIEQQSYSADILNFNFTKAENDHLSESVRKCNYITFTIILLNYFAGEIV